MDKEIKDIIVVIFNTFLAIITGGLWLYIVLILGWLQDER